MKQNHFEYVCLLLVFISCILSCASVKNSNVNTTSTKKGEKIINFIVDKDTKYQVIDGFGAGYTWYSDRLTWKNYKEPGFDALFKDAGMSILRFKNEYEYKERGTAPNTKVMVQYFNGATERFAEIGEKPIVLMSCWSPAAYLKENNDITGNATLRKNDNGEFCYDEYGKWWAESIKYYESEGVKIDYICIQNEVDFAASYDGCCFDSHESETRPAYSKAHIAVYKAMQELLGKDAPIILGPETMSCKPGTLAAYMKDVRESAPESFGGIAHHLYVGGTADGNMNGVDPDSYVQNFMGVNQFFEDTRKWQTEYYIGHAIDTAALINNFLIYENAHAYIYWGGVWQEDKKPVFESGKLLGAKANGKYTIKANYYAMMHFSKYIRPGYTRIKTISGNSSVASSAYISPDGETIVVILINREDDSKVYDLTKSSVTVKSIEAYQSVFGSECQSADTCWQTVDNANAEKLELPGKSVTTVVIK